MGIMKSVINKSLITTMSLLTIGCGQKIIPTTKKIPTTITGKVDFGMDGVKQMPTPAPTLLPEVVVKIDKKMPQKVVALPTPEPTAVPTPEATASPVQDFIGRDGLPISSSSSATSAIELFQQAITNAVPLSVYASSELAFHGKFGSGSGGWAYYEYFAKGGTGENDTIGVTNTALFYEKVLDQANDKVIAYQKTYSAYGHTRDEGVFSLDLKKIEIPGIIYDKEKREYSFDGKVIAKVQTGSRLYHLKKLQTGGLLANVQSSFRHEVKEYVALVDTERVGLSYRDEFKLPKYLTIIKTEDAMGEISELRMEATFEIIKMMARYIDPFIIKEFNPFFEAENTIQTLLSFRYDEKYYSQPYGEMINLTYQEACRRKGLPVVPYMSVGAGGDNTAPPIQGSGLFGLSKLTKPVMSVDLIDNYTIINPDGRPQGISHLSYSTAGSDVINKEGVNMGKTGLGSKYFAIIEGSPDDQTTQKITGYVRPPYRANPLKYSDYFDLSLTEVDINNLNISVAKKENSYTTLFKRNGEVIGYTDGSKKFYKVSGDSSFLITE